MGLLMTIIVILLILWLLGIVSSNTIGGLIYALLFMAIILILIWVVRERQPI